MPRPLLVTSEMRHRYCALIGVGCTRRYAASLLGVNESTIRTAMRRDEQFAAQVRQSEINRELVPLKNIQTAGQRSWKAHVDAGHVRAWRMLLDDASDRAAGRPTG